MLELIISPRALVADLTQFEKSPTEPLENLDETAEELEDPLHELLRRGASLQQDEFLAELRHQRNPEEAAV